MFMNATETIKSLKRKIMKDKLQFILILCITVYTIIFSYCTILRHYSFDSGAWDLGTYEQMLWTTINSGRLFYTAPDPINPTGLFFGTHFSPILFIILPIYFLHQATETLLVLQSFVLALGALPLYWLARDELKSKIAGFTIALAYLFYAPLHGVNWFDFHTQAFVPLFFNLAFYYFTKKKWTKYFVSIILVLSVNEAMPLMVVAMGIYGLWTRRNNIINYLSRRKSSLEDKTLPVALFTIFLGSIWFIVARKVINSINPHLPFTMWSEFGTDIPSIIISMITNPLHTLEVAFSYYAVDKFFYIVELFLPLLFISFLDPPSLFIALPWIGLSFLSNINPYITPVGYQYPAHILSIIFVSAIYGVKRLRIIKGRVESSPRFKWARSFKLSDKQFLRVALMLIIFCSVSTYIGLSPLGMNLKIGINGRPIGSTFNRVLRDVIAEIPKDASISTQDNVFPIFARRMNAYPYPTNKTDYILVDTRNMWYHIIFPFPHVESEIDVFNKHFDELISEVVADGSFGLFVAVDGIYLYKKDYQENATTPFLSEGLKAEFKDSSGDSVGNTTVLNISWDWDYFSPFPGNITRRPDQSDTYSITFTGFIDLPKTESYIFSLPSDGRSMLTISDLKWENGSINDWTMKFDEEIKASGEVRSGVYEITIYYENLGGDGAILFYWYLPWKKKTEIIPPQYFSRVE